MIERSKKYQDLLSRMDGLNKSFQDMIASKSLSWFFYHSTNLFLILNREGEIVQMNKPWVNLLGYSPEELDYTLFLDLIHPDDLKRTEKAWVSAAYIDKPDASPFYNRYRRKDANYVWVKWPTGSATTDPLSGYTQAVAEPVLDARLLYGLELTFGKTEKLFIP